MILLVHILLFQKLKFFGKMELTVQYGERRITKKLIVVERSIESRGKTGKGLVRRADQSFSSFAPAFDASLF